MNVLSPFLEFTRSQWNLFGLQTSSPLSEAEIERIRGHSTPLDIKEVEDIYIPLSRLIYMQFLARRHLHRTAEEFLHTSHEPVPFILGIAGSVAVGKSTTARVLQELLRRWKDSPRVDLVTTDGFLLDTATLEKRGIQHRKGFPESYDKKALVHFLNAVKSGQPQVKAPVYSHIKYDIVPNEFITIEKPDILILEGLNVLQSGPSLMVSDFFDFSIYVDAKNELLLDWYTSRFMKMREEGFLHPDSPFGHFASLDDQAAIEQAHAIWKAINLPNLLENILPTRSRADLVLVKDSNHLVDKIRMRKI